MYVYNIDCFISKFNDNLIINIRVRQVSMESKRKNIFKAKERDENREAILLNRLFML